MHANLESDYSVYGYSATAPEYTGTICSGKLRRIVYEKGFVPIFNFSLSVFELGSLMQDQFGN